MILDLRTLASTSRCALILFDEGLAPLSAVLAVATVTRAALECARAKRERSEGPVGPKIRERLEQFRRDC